MDDKTLSLPISTLILTDSPVVCAPETPLRQALDLMRLNKIGAIVITQDKIPIGIFTERDYISRIAGKGIDLSQAPIREFLSPKPKTIRRTDPIKNAILMMRVGNFRHLIVVDESNRLDSIVSVKDILNYLADELEVRF